jgi:hypothetical protein
MIAILPSCFLYTHTCTVYCSLRSTCAISSAEKSLTRTKKSLHFNEHYQENGIKFKKQAKSERKFAQDLSFISGKGHDSI